MRDGWEEKAGGDFTGTEGCSIADGRNAGFEANGRGKLNHEEREEGPRRTPRGSGIGEFVQRFLRSLFSDFPGD